LIIDNNSGHSIKLIASSITLGTAYLWKQSAQTWSHSTY
jgi:hypothetical protein